MGDTGFIDDLMEEEADTKEEDNDSKIDAKVAEALTAKEKGFYNEMKAERQRRQEIQTQLDKLTGTINGILESKKTATVLDEKPKKFAGIPVAETEDGDLYLPEEHIQKIVSPYEEKIKNLERYLQQSAVVQNSESEAQKTILAIVGEDETHGPAYQKYQAARKWANDKVVQFQKENGVRGQMTSGQALDYVFDGDVEKEFQQKFPGVPLDEIVTAEDSQRNFRKMLKSVSKVADSRKDTSEQDARLRKLLKKPSGLGSSPNAKAGHVNITEKLGSLTPQDIFELSDAQIRALQDALAREEKDGGLEF